MAGCGLWLGCKGGALGSGHGVRGADCHHLIMYLSISAGPEQRSVRREAEEGSWKAAAETDYG